MTHKAWLKIALAAACLAPGTAAAQLVHIKTDAGPEGRGLAVRGNGRCHVLAPSHVVDSAETITVGGRGRSTSSARVVKDFNSERGASRLDLAILEIDGKVACDEALPQAKQIADSLDAVSNVLIRRLEPDGTLKNSMALVRFVNPTDLSLTPGASPDDVLQQGDSGSIVYVDKTPVAMLVSSEPGEAGRYSAIRLDLASSLANGYFASLRSPVRSFRFVRFELDHPERGGGGSGRVLLTPEDLRTETDRLLSGTKGFPQIDNGAAADEVSVAGDLTLTAVALENGVRNNCSRKNSKLLGMSVQTYEPRDATSVCHNGFGTARSLMRFTFRLSGQVREGTGGAVVPILDQFQLVLPGDNGQANLMLATELSHRICARTSAAVAQLTPGAKGKAKPILGSNGLFGNANLIVPNLENPKLRTGC
jgi:hypothetical protein